MTPWFFSESIDYQKILGNPWINWFLNFPYDNTIQNIQRSHILQINKWYKVANFLKFLIIHGQTKLHKVFLIKPSEIQFEKLRFIILTTKLRAHLCICPT